MPVHTHRSEVTYFHQYSLAIAHHIPPFSHHMDFLGSNLLSTVVEDCGDKSRAAH